MFDIKGHVEIFKYLISKVYLGNVEFKILVMKTFALTEAV